jgi:two-component system, NarL family, nitrate/nitrite response regulator NarL
MSLVDLAPAECAFADSGSDRRQSVAARVPLESQEPRPRALVVSDIQPHRDALERSLGESPAVDIVGACAGAATCQQVRHLAPEVVVLDAAEGPGGAAGALMRTLKALVPELGVVVVTAVRDEAEFLAWAEAGVSGYADQNSSADDLAAAVRLAARGEVRCSPRLAALLAGRAAKPSAER